MAGGLDNALIATLLNYLTPTGAAGINGTAIGTPLGTTAMKLRLNSTLSTGASAGTDIGTQTSGYTAGGWTSLGPVHLDRHPDRGGRAADYPVVRGVRVADRGRQFRPDRQRGAAGVLGSVQRAAGERGQREQLPGGWRRGRELQRASRFP